MKSLKELGNEYREKIGVDSGVVIFHKGSVDGWVNKLRDPDHWIPGVTAVDVDGNQWVSVGGDEHNGAKKWEQTKRV